MRVRIISEHGYEVALFGLGLPHGIVSGLDYEKDFFPISMFANTEETQASLNYERFQRMEDAAKRLAGKGNGHDKFLRQIIVWLDITAPRYWWPEMDQYKVATVTQSESTMHSITKKEFELSDFEFPQSNDFLDAAIRDLNYLRDKYLALKDKRFWKLLIQLLPQSYLQRRILTCSYATLRNIIDQRTGHKLSEWAVFIDAIKTQCNHPELLP